VYHSNQNTLYTEAVHVKKMEPVRTTLFKRGYCGSVYRIPSLIYLTDDQSFLAFAEKRSSERDEDTEILVMRKGKWIQDATSNNGSIQWLDMVELTTAVLGCNGCCPCCYYRPMCPCPVYEKNTRTLFLFFICICYKTSESCQKRMGKNKARLCHVTSNDNGQTWSEATDLTESVIGDQVASWATFAVGPGHGIQMTDGKLVIPAYAYNIQKSCFCIPICCNVLPYSFAFYSDDNGMTWKVGEQIHLESCECEMAEIIDQCRKSHLYCNARNPKGGCRVEALCESSARNAFGMPHLATKLVDTGGGCQGSVIGFPAPKSHPDEQNADNKEDRPTWLLYSHPTDKSKRIKLGIYLNRSPLNPLGWEEPWIIHHGPSGYSDLALGENFGCLMECGSKSELEEIAFVQFSIEQVTAGRDEPN
ncbi:hypothetical protein JZ751_027359, partial [Albula glossodonta]